MGFFFFLFIFFYAFSWIVFSFVYWINAKIRGSIDEVTSFDPIRPDVDLESPQQRGQKLTYNNDSRRYWLLLGFGWIWKTSNRYGSLQDWIINSPYFRTKNSKNFEHWKSKSRINDTIKENKCKFDEYVKIGIRFKNRPPSERSAGPQPNFSIFWIF